VAGGDAYAVRSRRHEGASWIPEAPGIVGLGMHLPLHALPGPALLLWFRTDLRLHDHEALTAALQSGVPVVLVYCVDPRQFSTLNIGVHKTGAFRARFLLESIADLRASCRALGGDLVVRVGEPERVLPELAASLGAHAVYYHADSAPEEGAVERAVARSLSAIGVETRAFAGHTLLHADDLPTHSRSTAIVWNDEWMCGRR